MGVCDAYRNRIGSKIVICCIFRYWYQRLAREYKISYTKKLQRNLKLFVLVAGTGLEPVTFGL